MQSCVSVVAMKSLVILLLSHFSYVAKCTYSGRDKVGEEEVMKCEGEDYERTAVIGCTAVR